jgi:hypothetical protein
MSLDPRGVSKLVSVDLQAAEAMVPTAVAAE